MKKDESSFSIHINVHNLGELVNWIKNMKIFDLYLLAGAVEAEILLRKHKERVTDDKTSM